jgi:Spy/CpxP family protein refolding chaperone
MKKIIVALALCSVFIIGAQAQVKREADPSQMIQSKQKKGKMINELSLTKEQRSQIKDFHKAVKQQKESIANDNTLSDEQKQFKLKELKKDERKKINSILTPEQKEKLKERRKNARKQEISS